MRQILLILLACLFAGCASTPKVDRNRDWNAFVGKYTFDEAVAELGQPDAIGAQPDGSRFAEWILQRSPQMSFGFGVGHGAYGSHGGISTGVGTTVSPPPSGEYLHLSFGTNGLLNAWTRARH